MFTSYELCTAEYILTNIIPCSMMYQLRRKPRTSLSIIDMLTRDTLEASAYLAKPRSGSFRPYFAPAASLSHSP